MHGVHTLDGVAIPQSTTILAGPLLCSHSRITGFGRIMAETPVCRLGLGPDPAHPRFSPNYTHISLWHKLCDS